MQLRTLIPATAAVGAAAFGYATVVERNWFVLRRYEIPVLSPGSGPLRVLHISDTHLTPGRKRLMSWIRALDVANSKQAWSPPVNSPSLRLKAPNGDIYFRFQKENCRRLSQLESQSEE